MAGAHGRALRPIEREQWSQDKMAAGLLGLNQSAKLSIGYSQYRQRFPSAAAGVPLTRPLGGGTYVPIQAPQSPAGNIGTT
jgi:hypothetical protein